MTTELFLAKGAKLGVFDATRLHFEIKGRKMFADVLVSGGVDELFLGYDWLVQNNCEWIFSKRSIKINGLCVYVESSCVKLLLYRLRLVRT